MLFFKDHLELFFGAIRSRNGCNNNPTARQFISSFKQLLIHSQIKGSNGNCEMLDKTAILHVTKNVIKASDDTEKDITDIKSNDASIIEDERLDEKLNDNDLNAACDAIDSIELSDFKENTIGYISGYVVRMVKRY